MFYLISKRKLVQEIVSNGSYKVMYGFNDAVCSCPYMVMLYLYRRGLRVIQSDMNDTSSPQMFNNNILSTIWI